MQADNKRRAAAVPASRDVDCRPDRGPQKGRPCRVVRGCAEERVARSGAKAGTRRGEVRRGGSGIGRKVRLPSSRLISTDLAQPDSPPSAQLVPIALSEPYQNRGLRSSIGQHPVSTLSIPTAHEGGGKKKELEPRGLHPVHPEELKVRWQWQGLEVGERGVQAPKPPFTISQSPTTPQPADRWVCSMVFGPGHHVEPQDHSVSSESSTKQQVSTHTKFVLAQHRHRPNTD
ncbi:hypothetical protein NDU88_000930 [Pleurodeles waltl]|uniref:Uncharacterized protein n=1 Tax=Pleurodeles waltl TaxID=8319 RepID=A0AAV7TIP9_PLEWA|nr:hypothetical protein NDU88_000930 [Pleurodeles waltl]